MRVRISQGFREAVCKSYPYQCRGYKTNGTVFGTANPREIPGELMASPNSGIHNYCTNYKPVMRLRVLVE